MTHSRVIQHHHSVSGIFRETWTCFHLTSEGPLPPRLKLHFSVYLVLLFSPQETLVKANFFPTIFLRHINHITIPAKFYHHAQGHLTPWFLRTMLPYSSFLRLLWSHSYSFHKPIENFHKPIENLAMLRNGEWLVWEVVVLAPSEGYIANKALFVLVGKSRLTSSVLSRCLEKLGWITHAFWSHCHFLNIGIFKWLQNAWVNVGPWEKNYIWNTFLPHSCCQKKAIDTNYTIRV